MYQYAKCLFYKNNVQDGIEALYNILKILKEKWTDRILSPVEYKYLQNVISELESIKDENQYYINDKLLKEIKQLTNKNLMINFKDCIGIN